jgi:hypothetical protein
MGLATSQTRKPNRVTVLLLIAVLLSFALWLIGLAARSNGYDVRYGSRKKAASTLSILSLAQHWIAEMRDLILSDHQLDKALIELADMVMTYQI